jgi:hypothetical protein
VGGSISTGGAVDKNLQITRLNKKVLPQ